jgi:hypothetical protein
MYAALVSLGDGTELRWSRLKRAQGRKEGCDALTLGTRAFMA